MGRLTTNVERAFGIRWQDWGKLAAVSWLATFVLSWVAMPITWKGGNAGYWMCGTGLFGVLLANAVPGMAALACRPVRQRLRAIPEAAALSLLSVSGAVGFVGTVALSAPLPGWPDLGAVAMVIGMLAFPMTFGTVFPLAIPLACALKAWKDARRNGTVSRLRFAVLWGIAAVGWLGVGLAGLVLASA